MIGATQPYVSCNICKVTEKLFVRHIKCTKVVYSTLIRGLRLQQRPCQCHPKGKQGATPLQHRREVQGYTAGCVQACLLRHSHECPAAADAQVQAGTAVKAEPPASCLQQPACCTTCTHSNLSTQSPKLPAHQHPSPWQPMLTAPRHAAQHSVSATALLLPKYAAGCM